MNTSNTNGYTNVPITFLQIYKYGCVSFCCNQILSAKFDAVFRYERYLRNVLLIILKRLWGQLLRISGQLLQHRQKTSNVR